MLIVCNLSETTQMFNNGNIYQHMKILLVIHELDSKNLSKIKRLYNVPVFIWSLEKAWLCDNQSIKPVNEDDPELKNWLQVNVEKTDITVTSKLQITSSWIRISKLMTMVLLAASIWIKRITKHRPSEIATSIKMELLEKA